MYRQWTSTDQADLTSHKCTVKEHIELAAKGFLKLIPHDFIAKKQSEYLRQQKENLPKNKAIILMDLSMNCTCLVQDSSQSYHWSKKEVTVHPVVVYYRDGNDELAHKSICCISNDLDHDVDLVQKFQELTLD